MESAGQELDFNVLSTAQGHPRTVKLCHWQTHIRMKGNPPTPIKKTGRGGNYLV